MSPRREEEGSARSQRGNKTSATEQREETAAMNEKIRVIQYGLGPIGCATARLIAERDNLELVGGVDIERPADAPRTAAVLDLWPPGPQEAV